eukprot:CAMPEP_0173402702 /NCGR_PEP_ID=MMETSP1356-20130122/54732_1 /TAXON_ID=77927 ORGANISM="Hemiselmis virescens, Strain PCC157" /NCGR_SAMPLE_ID=MMETSP1356 /ASSEMBLY_ACC=CAM_ASM_000847 /LENGTH=48 /DNA_ID= /DNA_START= /DNA_END= /DNA_ORIENTATION=
MSRILEWLRSSGLEKFQEQFRAIGEDQFLGLQMQDYAEYNVVLQEDRR